MDKASPLLFLLSAPSGGGKTTLCQHMLAANPDLTRVITCTTRAPRDGEKDGFDYYFLSEASFTDRVQAGHFLEHATVYGNRYGTLKTEVMDKLRLGKDVLLTVDVQGAASIRLEARADAELQRSLVTVFLTPPSLKALQDRLRHRGTDSAEVCLQRLSLARQEIAQWIHFDFLIVSSTVAEDVRRAQAILIAEKLRQSRAAGPLLEAMAADGSADPAAAIPRK
jgi:guanylate kinase